MEEENKAKTYVIGLYEVELAYGGPEEGGWWYRRGQLVRTVAVFRNENKAYAYSRKLNRRLESREFGPNRGKRELSSVLSDGEYQIEVHENLAPAFYPEVRPHYE